MQSPVRSRRVVAIAAAVGVVLVLAAPRLLPATASAEHPDWDEWQFLNLMNAERRTAGLPPVAMAPRGRDVARAWTGRMVGAGALSHNPDFRSQLAAQFPAWTRVGENVGVGGSVEQVHAAFMNSPGHRANILNSSYRYAGIGVTWAASRIWVTVNFVASGGPVQWTTRAPVSRVVAASDPDTAVLVSRRRAAGSADAAVVARVDSYADALAGVPLASVKRGPVLLTPSGEVPPNVVDEAARVVRPGGRVYLLGGPAALSPAVELAFARAGLAVQRLAGTDRFATATAVAAEVSPDPTEVFVVSGVNYADAVVAGAAAGARGVPVLLTAPTEVPGPTRTYLDVTRPTRRILVGGASAITDVTARALGSTQRVAGSDRYATAVAVANVFFPNHNRVAVVPGGRFVEALVAGPEAARLRMPVMLSSAPPANPTYDHIGRNASRWADVVVVGRDLGDEVLWLLFS